GESRADPVLAGLDRMAGAAQREGRRGGDGRRRRGGRCCRGRRRGRIDGAWRGARGRSCRRVRLLGVRRSLCIRTGGVRHGRSLLGLDLFLILRSTAAAGGQRHCETCKSGKGNFAHVRKLQAIQPRCSSALRGDFNRCWRRRCGPHAASSRQSAGARRASIASAPGPAYPPLAMTGQQPPSVTPPGSHSWRGEAAATFRLGWPLALANLLQMLIYAIDVIFIARLGEAPLAASALTVAILGLLLWALSGLTGAVAPLIAAELGARAPALRPIRRATRMAMWLAVLSGLAGMALCTLAEPFMLLTGQEPRIARLADEYMAVLLFSLVPMLIANVLRSFVSALGRPILATVITAGGI